MGGLSLRGGLGIAEGEVATLSWVEGSCMTEDMEDRDRKYKECGKVGAFVRSATITKYHRLGGSSIGNLVFHSSGDWKCKFKMPAGLVSGECSLLNLQTATLSLGPHMAFPLGSYLLSLPFIRTLIPL